MSSVLLVDDEPGVLFTLSELLTERGHRVIESRSGDDALRKLDEADAVLTDLAMPGMDGLELVSHIVQRDPTLPVILLTAHGSERVAVAAMKQGAYDYLKKPFDIDEVAVVIERALEARRLRIDNRRLSAEQTIGRRIIGDSRPMINNRPVFDLPDPFAPGPGTPPLPPACVVPDAIQFGRYLLRDDDAGWLRDAQGFGANIEATNTFARVFLSKPFPPMNDAQFFWNYPWLWEPTGSPATDQSPSFPGSVHIALIEGHGLPWWISTEKNCCDVIDLTQITGFGGYHTPGELTDYVIWQSCSVVPAPGDPYGGNYASPASPFDVWFTIFQGLRGTYGYRSEMNIWNGVGMAFASDIGFGVANLTAWFNECNNNVFHHGNGWNYGSAVLISGQEGDTLYDTCALPPPGSLTIWWQHP